MCYLYKDEHTFRLFNTIKSPTIKIIPGTFYWLPGRYSDSGLLWHFTALVTEQGKWNHRIISIVREGQTPDEARRIRPKPPKIYRNLIFRAKEYARMIESGLAKNESDLARKVGISRVRIWQYTSLLNLNASLVEAVEALGDPMPKRLITERQLRQMLKSPKEQERFLLELQTNNVALL